MDDKPVLGHSEIPKKKYFRIGEAGKIIGVEPHVLRYWETEFTIIKPYRPKSGQRLYRKKDVKNFLRIKLLLYDEGYTIAGARKILSRKGSGEDSDPRVLKKPACIHAGDRLTFIKGELQAIMDCVMRDKRK